MNIPAPFSQNQKDYFDRTFTHWLNIAEGGKRGGNNVVNTLAFCTRLERHQSRIHLIAGVSTATAKINVLDCDGFGMKNFFEGRCREGEYKKRDCVYIQTRIGEKIVLISGGGKSGDEKLIKGNTYGMAYVTEANECTADFIQEVFDRTLTSPERAVFHDLNPKGDGHWYYKTVLDFHAKKQKKNPDYGFNYGHFTIADNVSVSDDNLRKQKKMFTVRQKPLWIWSGGPQERLPLTMVLRILVSFWTYMTIRRRCVSIGNIVGTAGKNIDRKQIRNMQTIWKHSWVRAAVQYW